MLLFYYFMFDFIMRNFKNSLRLIFLILTLSGLFFSCSIDNDKEDDPSSETETSLLSPGELLGRAFYRSGYFVIGNNGYIGYYQIYIEFVSTSICEIRFNARDMVRRWSNYLSIDETESCDYIIEGDKIILKNYPFYMNGQNSQDVEYTYCGDFLYEGYRRYYEQEEPVWWG